MGEEASSSNHLEIISEHNEKEAGAGEGSSLTT